MRTSRAREIVRLDGHNGIKTMDYETDKLRPRFHSIDSSSGYSFHPRESDLTVQTYVTA